jgi:hypothetical protein
VAGKGKEPFLKKSPLLRGDFFIVTVVDVSVRPRAETEKKGACETDYSPRSQ